ncbi:MAG: ABC transporter ATP-binding protein [Neisseria sp.]|nr:ABC transporter ATP-binding protein [Neisseria sp.]
MLNISNLSVTFGTHTVLQHFDFDLQNGETACLLGSSGCGKTTALRAIAGFETPQTGEIVLNGRNLAGIAPHKRGIGMVFQDYALFPHLSVAGNIAFGLHALSRKAKQARTAELLELINLKGCADKYPHQLSGGQQQRVALARALAPKPALILLDEPFSNLDADLRQRLSKDVRELLKQQQTAAVLVTHDQQEAFAMADRIAIMQQGRLKQYGSAQELYERPAAPEVAAFIGQGSLIGGEVQPDGSIASPLGRHTLPLPCCAGEKVQLFIRPDRLALAENAAPNARIRHLEYKGSHYAATLALANGETLLMDLPAGSAWQENTPLAVKLNGSATVFTA